MADVHGSPGAAGQMPQAGSGPAPVPYAGADQSPEPPDYAVTLGADVGGASSQVMADLPAGNAVQESAYAHDMNAGLVNQYYAGAISPIQVHGDPDPGGRDDVSATVAGAVAAAEARWHEYESDILPQGSAYGDFIHFPPAPLDPGAGVGNTDPAGGFFDPPRGYGGAEGAPGYAGNEPPPGYQGEAQ